MTSWKDQPKDSKKQSHDKRVTSLRVRLFDLHVGGKRDSEEYAALLSELRAIELQPVKMKEDRY